MNSHDTYSTANFLPSINQLPADEILKIEFKVESTFSDRRIIYQNCVMRCEVLRTFYAANDDEYSTKMQITLIISCKLYAISCWRSLQNDFFFHFLIKRRPVLPKVPAFTRKTVTRFYF